MASKKKSKQVQPADSQTSQNNSLLGGKLNGIAVALLTALVTEIVQQVLDRLFTANSQPDRAGTTHHSSQGSGAPDLPDLEAEPKPVTAAAIGEEPLPPVKPIMQDVLKAVQTTIQEAAPRLNEAIAVLKAASNDPQQAVATLVRDAVNGTKDSLDTAAASTAPRVDSWISSALSVTQSAIDSIATAAPAVSAEKGKKKKGKKKKGKKSKKK